MARRMLRVACIAAVVLVAASIAPAARSAGTVPVPALSLPPAGTHGHPLWDSYYQLAPFGYEEQELFVSGTAEGNGTPAPYTTRMIVTRPTDPARFNGTVVLDWVNVSAQFENAVTTMLTREMLMREGFTFVHVSVQPEGLCCLPLFTLKSWDPVRYAALDHPGNDYDADILTQVAQAFRTAPSPGALDPMGPLGVASVQHVIVAGQSQSAIRLYDYVDSWLPAHPEAVGIIDGVLMHGAVTKPKTFSHPVAIPVLDLRSDFEGVNDGVDPSTLDPNVRLWEIAGTAHADYFIGYQSVYGSGPRFMADAPQLTRAQFEHVVDGAGNYGEVLDPLLGLCIVAGTTMPMHYAASAALYQLTSWVRGEGAPAHGPRFEFNGVVQARDAYGNALGGIRLPPIDVPIATYQSTLCGLGGITVPFTDVQIATLYPTHADYLALMRERTDASVAAGWLLPEDATDLMRRACRASSRWTPGQAPCPAYTPPAFGIPLSPTTPATPTPEGADVDIEATAGSPVLPATGGRSVLPLAIFVVALAFAGRRLAFAARMRG